MQWAYAGQRTDPCHGLRIVARGDGVLSVTCRETGVTVTGGVLDPEVKDGLGYADLDNLEPGTRYTVDVYIAGDLVVTLTVATLPLRAGFSFAWGSCFQASDVHHSLQRAAGRGALFFVEQGDFPYSNMQFEPAWSDFTILGSAANALTVEAYHTTLKREHQNPGYITSALTMAHVVMPDDHEWAGDNRDGTPEMALAQHPITDTPGITSPTPTQAEVDAAHWAAKQAMLDYMQGNPDCSDSERDNEKPMSSDEASPASWWPPSYTRWGNELVEFFLIDAITHRSPIDNGQGSLVQYDGKTMLGSRQKAWLKKYLKESTATFKVIFCGKPTYSAVGPNNGDTFQQYTAERDELLADFAANGITGVIWLVGDRHTPQVHATTTSSDTDVVGVSGTYDHVCVCACTYGGVLNTQESFVGNQTVWINPVPESAFHQVYGLAHVTEEYIELEIRGVGYGGEDPLWSARVHAGENYARYLRPRLTIG
ncbi:hypothetical protein HC928_00615 [bacterium]|nr:hypothetical protein [bacterium]